MILSGDPNVFGGTKIGKFISSLFNSNQMRNLLNEPIPNNIIRGTDQSGKPLRNISIQDLREKKAIITFYDQNSMKNYINTVSDQFSEAYQGTSMFHWIKNTVAKTLFAVTGAGLIANIAIPASAAMSMGSPSSAAMQQAANINAGGSEPVNSQPLNSKPTSPTGHPNLTNGSNFGNLGGVQGNPNLGPSNSNVPFSNRVIDYSTMYRENSVDDNRVVVAQMDQKVSIPAEAYAQINQAPDLESFMQQIIQVLQSNGGPDNPKAIEAVNAYIANVNSKIQPIMNLLSAMPEGA
jgi:hypothetical protein